MSERGWPDEKENCSETIGVSGRGRILKRGDGEFPLEFPIRRKRHIKSDHFFVKSYPITMNFSVATSLPN